jgi:hypothetical protein
MIKVMRKCVICKEEINPKRLEILPNAVKCVSCSTTGKKAGVSVVLGEGDHTFNEIVIMEPEEYDQFQELELRLNGPRKDDVPNPDEAIEEEDEEVETELEGIEEIAKISLDDLEE